MIDNDMRRMKEHIRRKPNKISASFDSGRLHITDSSGNIELHDVDQAIAVQDEDSPYIFDSPVVKGLLIAFYSLVFITGLVGE